MSASNTTPLNATPLRPDSRKKPAPSARNFNQIVYTPSPSGIDSNLLLILHGLGDTSDSFVSLSTTLQKTLPQTATVIIQGSQRIPILPEKAFSYWDTITPLGEVIDEAHQDPRKWLEAFERWIREEVTGRCGWKSEDVHLFGFGQGGTAAVEAVLYCEKQRRLAKEESIRFGSVVSVCGSLLSVSSTSESSSCYLSEAHCHCPSLPSPTTVPNPQSTPLNAASSFPSQPFACSSTAQHTQASFCKHQNSQQANALGARVHAKRQRVGRDHALLERACPMEEQNKMGTRRGRPGRLRTRLMDVNLMVISL